MTRITKNNTKPSVEVADIFREHIVDYQQTYSLCPEHYKIVYDLLNCRTAYLGGHIQQYDFTLPHELNPLILSNKAVMLDILFKSVSETLLTFGKNPQNGVGGKLGFIAILHTWDQLLNAHFHLHCLTPGGAVSDDWTC